MSSAVRWKKVFGQCSHENSFSSPISEGSIVSFRESFIFLTGESGISAKRAFFSAGEETGESRRATLGDGRLTASESLLSRITLASVGRKTGRRGERTSIFFFISNSFNRINCISCCLVFPLYLGLRALRSRASSAREIRNRSWGADNSLNKSKFGEIKERGPAGPS